MKNEKGGSGHFSQQIYRLKKNEQIELVMGTRPPSSSQDLKESNLSDGAVNTWSRQSLGGGEAEPRPSLWRRRDRAETRPKKVHFQDHGLNKTDHHPCKYLKVKFLYWGLLAMGQFDTSQLSTGSWTKM